MFRNIGAAILSVLIGFFFVGFMVRFNHNMFPMPEHLTQNDTEGLKAHIESLPSKAFYLVMIGHIVGAFLATFISSKLAGSHKFIVGLLCLAVMFIATVSNFLILPHPIWVIIIDLVGVLIFGFLGARLGAGAVPDYDF